jgi:hypothetical protein
MSDYLQEEVDLGASGYLGEVTQRWKTILSGEFHASGVPLNAFTPALASTLLVKAGAGMIFGFAALNTGTAQYLQLHDTVTVPGSGAAPVAVWAAADGSTNPQNINVSWIFPGRFFQRGCWLVNSTTAATYTAGSANCFFDVQYI